MSNHFPIKRGDTGPDLVVNLTSSSGTVPDLTGATVYFHMRRANAKYQPIDIASSVLAEATVTDVDTKEITYAWAVGDTDLTPGFYCGEMEVIFSSGQRITYPDDSWIPIKIYQDLGDGEAPT